MSVYRDFPKTNRALGKASGSHNVFSLALNNLILVFYSIISN
jgi:hypothetical protein